MIRGSREGTSRPGTVVVLARPPNKSITHEFVHECPILLKDAVNFIKTNDVRQAYKKHNMYVQSIVPKEDLLIWNLKDGWEPLCSFLGKEIQEGPIPHDNKTGDEEFILNYLYRHKLYSNGLKYFAKNFIFLLLKIVLGLYFVRTFFGKIWE